MPRYLSPQVQPIFLSKKDADAALEQLPAGHGAKLEVIDLLSFLQQLVVRYASPPVSQTVSKPTSRGTAVLARYYLHG
eukprot:scaffold64771_cov37-Phaeocystis_antarctica.AAC.1